jgi:hypothetical protein
VTAQYWAHLSPGREDLGELVFFLCGDKKEGQSVRLRERMSLTPPVQDLTYSVPTDSSISVLPLEKVIRIPPTQALAMQLRVHCGASQGALKYAHDIGIVSASLYEVMGFKTLPEHVFDMVVHAISSRGEKLCVTSDHVYTVAPEPFYPAVTVLRGDELSHLGAAFGGQATLELRSWHSEEYPAFLRRMALEHAEHVEHAQPRLWVGASNITSFVESISREYPNTVSLLRRLSVARDTPESDRTKIAWLLHELDK